MASVFDQASRSPDPVVELRQYTLHPGQRDTLIEIFDREFVESQENLGMRVIGQFRDLDKPDRFVWLRSFPDMTTREQALASFYGGPVWKTHGPAANATMIDSDNVLLLRPVRPSTAFPMLDGQRPPVDATVRPSSLTVATLCFLPAAPDEQFLRYLDDEVLPCVVAAGAVPIALMESESATNTFPALPVRKGEHVVTWFARFDSRDAYGTHRERLAETGDWRDRILPELMKRLIAEPEVLHLAPTARSALR
jgi:NIPSNAP